MRDVRVTICIPHLMREHLLYRCLKSVEKNVSVPYKVLIVNDGRKRLHFKKENITVINNEKREGLGAARKKFADLVETEFLFALDNDILVWPGSLEVLIEALDKNPELGVISGICFDRGSYCSEVAKFVFVGSKVIKRLYSLDDILSFKGDIFYADFVPISHTLFRMETVKEIAFDPNYKIGYEHWDTFMQLYYTSWKCAVHKRAWFSHLHHHSPKKYLSERYRKTEIQKSKDYFIKKWGYVPIQPYELKTPKKAPPVIKVLRRLLNWQRRFLRASGILT